MESRVTKINKTTLFERGILAIFKNQLPHPEVYLTIWRSNFNFL